MMNTWSRRNGETSTLFARARIIISMFFFAKGMLYNNFWKEKQINNGLAGRRKK